MAVIRTDGRFVQRDKSIISKHIKNIFEDGELVRESTVAKFATVQNEGNTSKKALQWIMTA